MSQPAIGGPRLERLARQLHWLDTGTRSPAWLQSWLGVTPEEFAVVATAARALRRRHLRLVPRMEDRR